jgi:CrcB protein
MNYLLVFTGGGLGSILRYWLTTYVRQNFESAFPFATLSVNILSSFVLGLLAGMLTTKSNGAHSMLLLLSVGFCGGFSTFSAFTFDLYSLIKSGFIGQAMIDIFLSVSLCVVALYGGVLISKI